MAEFKADDPETGVDLSCKHCGFLRSKFYTPNASDEPANFVFFSLRMESTIASRLPLRIRSTDSFSEKSSKSGMYVKGHIVDIVTSTPGKSYYVIQFDSGRKVHVTFAQLQSAYVYFSPLYFSLLPPMLPTEGD